MEYTYNAYYPIVLEEARRLPLYIAVVGRVQKENGIFRPGGIEHHQLLFTKHGEGRAYLGKKPYAVKKDTVFYLPQGATHHYCGEINPWTTYCITFGGVAASFLFENEPFIASLEHFDHYEERILSMMAMERDENWAYRTSVLLYEILLNLKKDIQCKQVKRDDAMQYMIQNYDKQISLEELAALAHISPQSFCRAFKNKYGVRPLEYITLLRMQKAKELLIRDRTLTVKEIGRLVGYQDPSYFGMLFKKYEHMTPQTFRDYN